VSVRLIVLPEAESDLREAVRWYERHRRGLGAEFLGTVEAAWARIIENPRVGRVWSDDERYRRITLLRFPYVVFYELRSDSIEIVAVAHSARGPGFMQGRSRKGLASENHEDP
jgi:toxin ParE1/3/4